MARRKDREAQPLAATPQESYVKTVRPQSENQRRLMDALDVHELVLALGPAGTGKTYLALDAAVKALRENEVERLVLTRPAIEAGENLGFLPGDLEEKLAPYLRPLYDILSERLGGKTMRGYMANGTIEIAPIAYMRGRTISNAFIVVDEAQNCTYTQIKMLLTRLGRHSTMVFTGDPDQSDLPNGQSGLGEIANRLRSLENVSVVDLDASDIVRHPLITEVLKVL